MKKIRVIGLLIVTIFIAAGCTSKVKEDNAVQNTYKQMTMEEAKEVIEKESGFVILDVRTREEFSEGHIPGAINLANEDIGEEEIPQLPDKDQQILVYCRSGNRSRQASNKLAKLGYSNVVDIGGILDWDGEIEK